MPQAGISTWVRSYLVSLGLRNAGALKLFPCSNSWEAGGAANGAYREPITPIRSAPLGAARRGGRCANNQRLNGQAAGAMVFESSAHTSLSIALVKIAKAIEALLQILCAASLLLPNGRPRYESAPSEMRHAVTRPS
jgi:hypothetical protein